MNPWIEIRSGSDSDLPKLRPAFDFLEEIGISFSPHVLSAHRSPHLAADRARGLELSGYRACIAAAGGAAHLAGVTAAETILPVIGIPVGTSNLEGLDSLYSVIQMPDGIPVGTVGIDQSEAAGILAAQISALGNPALTNRIRARRGLKGEVTSKKVRSCVSVLRPRSVQPSPDKYEGAIKLFRELGAETVEQTLKKLDRASVRASCAQAERDGAAAILALCDEETVQVPRLLADATHLPVVAVPFAEGRIGSRTGRPQDDLLSRMLCAYDKKGQATGSPVAGIGLNRIKNGVLYCGLILGVHLPAIRSNLKDHRAGLTKDSERKNALLGELGAGEYLKRMQKA